MAKNPGRFSIYSTAADITECIDMWFRKVMRSFVTPANEFSAPVKHLFAAGKHVFAWDDHIRQK